MDFSIGTYLLQKMTKLNSMITNSVPVDKTENLIKYIFPLDIFNSIFIFWFNSFYVHKKSHFINIIILLCKEHEVVNCSLKTFFDVLSK